MKRTTLFLLVAVFATISLFAQEGVKNYASIKIRSGTYFVASNNMNFTNAATGNLTIQGAARLENANANAAGNSGITVANGANLLQNSDGVNATVKQEIIADRWHLISNPVAPFDLSTTFLGNYYLYEEKNDAWPNAAGGLMQNNRGYLIKNADNATTLSFKGTLNNGDMLYPLTFDGKGNSYNLVGNPYSCAIDWSVEEGFDKSNISGVMYVWDGTQAQYGSNNGDASTFNVGNIIHANQGFIVKANSTATGGFTVKNAAKTIDLAAPFYKNTLADLLRIRLSGEEGVDEVVIYFKEGATENYDLGIDADKFFGTSVSLYSLTGEGKPMAINATSTTVKTIPLNFTSTTDGNYTLRVNEYTFTTDIIYIEDKLTGTVELLSENVEYTFFHASENTADRFVLHFNSTPTAIDEFEEISNITIFAAQGKLNVLNAQNANIQVFDLLGKQIYSAWANSNAEQIELPENAIYIVKTIKNNKISTKKIMINN